MAISNGYASVAELQRKLGRAVDSGDPQFSFFEECIERASRYIDDRVGRIYYQLTLSSEVVDTVAPSENGLRILRDQKTIVSPCPIISISSIIEDGVTLVEGTDYYLYKAQGKIQKSGRWSSTPQGISVSGVIGYASTPEKVGMWCVSIAAALTGLDIRQWTDDSGSVQTVLQSTVPQWVLDDIDGDREYVI